MVNFRVAWFSFLLLRVLSVIFILSGLKLLVWVSFEVISLAMCLGVEIDLSEMWVDCGCRDSVMKK